MTGGFYGDRACRLHACTRVARRILVGGLAWFAWPLAAQTFTDAWERARSSEPGLQAALADYRAASERSVQARGALFPQFDASANNQSNWRKFVQEPFPDIETSESYPSRTVQINITQPIWRPLNWTTLSQARVAEQQATLQVLATEHDLHTRFIVAWFDMMGARDNVTQAGCAVDATQHQLKVMQHGLKLGTHSDVQAADAQARYEQALADKTAAEAEFGAKLALLEQLTGPLHGFVPPLLASDLAALTGSELEPLDFWLSRANVDNAALQSAERALAAAREEVRRQQTLHHPTLDLVARHARVFQASGTTPGQSGYKSHERSVGLQLNVPLFTGGTTTAKVREAEAHANKAESELEGARRNAVAQVKQGWAAIQAAMGRNKAAALAVQAAQVALKAATMGKSNGSKTLLDELQARHQLATAQRDKQRADYDTVVGLVRLRSAAGLSPAELVPRIDALLRPGSE